MAIREHPTKGTGHWQIDYYPQGRNGKRARLSYQGTREQAVMMEAELRRIATPVKIHTHPRIEQVIPDFLTWYKLERSPAGVERTVYSLQRLLPFFGRYQFQQISTAMVDEYKAMRLEQVKPVTINKELAALSVLCKWANEQGYCHEIKVKRFPTKLTRPPKPVIIPRDQVLKLINEIKPDRRGVIAAMYFAGLRSSEARYLKRENVFLDRDLILVTGKGNKERLVPIRAPLKPYLEEGRAEGYLWINPSTEKPWSDLRGSLKGAAKRAGVEQRVYAHLMRHCFGTHGTESGVGLRTLQESMGHSTSQVTELYTTLAADHLKEDMQKMDVDYSSQISEHKKDD